MWSIHPFIHPFIPLFFYCSKWLTKHRPIEQNVDVVDLDVVAVDVAAVVAVVAVVDARMATIRATGCP